MDLEQGSLLVHGWQKPSTGFRRLPRVGSGYLFGLPVPVYLMLIVLAVGTVYAQRTNCGQEIYAIGANPVAARLSGIPVRRRQLLWSTRCPGHGRDSALNHLPVPPQCG